MKKYKSVILLLLAVVILSSCSTMYLKPTIQPTLYRQEIPGEAEFLFKVALRILPLMGYRIAGSDPDTGTIKTRPYDMKLNPGDCDCGSAMGLPVIKSEGIKAKVYFILAVSNGELAIKAEIEPELTGMMSTLASAGVTFMCVSKGGLEQAFARKFVNEMKDNALKLIFN